MVRLYLFAEGQTEQTFADTVLKPHLANFQVYMHKPVFSDVSKFGFFFDNTVAQVRTLKKIVDDARSPEQIDDGQHTAPSKRITQQFPEYEDKKTIIGPQMAERIGVNIIRCKCRHFNSWMEQLEKLAPSSRENR